MDLHRHAGLVDRLAAEYALGVLQGGSRRRFENIARNDPVIRLAIETWRWRLQSMAELGATEAPPPEIWEAIERRLELTKARPSAARAAAPRGWFENLSFWRSWSIAATAMVVLGLVAALGHLVPFFPLSVRQVAQESRVAYVATLADKHSRALVLVTWDDKTSEMTVRRLSGASDPSDKSMQLWGLPKQGHPVSLGVLPRGATVRMKVSSVSAFPVLAISVEPLGGSPNPDAPTGAVIYTGKVIPTA